MTRSRRDFYTGGMSYYLKWPSEKISKSFLVAVLSINIVFGNSYDWSPEGLLPKMRLANIPKSFLVTVMIGGGSAVTRSRRDFYTGSLAGRRRDKITP